MNETKEEFFRELQDMVEELRKLDGCKVVMISHSMGSPLTRMFLSKKGQKWINQNVRAWVSLNGAFAGSKSAVISRTYGMANWDIVNYLKDYVQTFMSTFASIYYLQPSKAYFGDEEVGV